MKLPVSATLVLVLSAGMFATARAADFGSQPDNVWVKQSPRPDAPVPHFGWEASGAYDPYIKKWIHWGGHDGIPQGFPLFLWDPQTGKWEQKFPNTSPPGVCCVDGAETLDAANRRFVRFPGASGNHGWQWTRKLNLKNSAVWLYDPAANTWMNMRPAPYKEPGGYSKQVLGALDACGTYDGKHDVALSFGGQGAGGGMNNLFAYDAYANYLEMLPAGSPPSERDGSGFCYDSKNDCAVVFGSQYSEDAKTYVYRYAAKKWEAHDLNPRPSAKKNGSYSTIPKMAYDSINGICLCVVWLGEKEGHETWAFDAEKLAWAKLSPAAEAANTKSRARNLWYDRGLNLFFMETYSVASEPQMWTYRYKKAPANLPAEPPADLACVTSEGGKVSLSWTASSTAGVKEYNVYRAQADKPWVAQFAKIATVKTAKFDDTGLDAGKVCFYTVRAVGGDGKEGGESFTARTQPRVLVKPTVSVLAANKIEVSWNAHPAKDIAGYNVYRGLVAVATNTALTKSWGFNDPAYPEPVVDKVKDIANIEKVNDKPVVGTTFTDDKVDLAKKGAESGDYKYAVYAYIVRAVNKMGSESGPSPYALTIPSEPVNVLLREKGGAEIKWDAPSAKGVAGYRVYRYGKPMELVSGTDLLKGTTFTDGAAKGTARYSVVAVDGLGQEGEPSSPVWFGQSYKGFFRGEWHQ